MRDSFYDHPKLREAFDIYCQRRCAEFPTDAELAHITFSPEFEERMYRIIRREQRGYYVMFGTIKRSVASVLLMLLAGMTIATFSVRALREPVVRFITEVFESFTSVLFVNDEPGAVVTEMKTIAPAYIPEGYVVESEMETDISYRIIYSNTETGLRLSYTQRWNGKGFLGVNTENIEHHAINVNGLEGIAYIQNDTTSIMFTDGEYTFTVTSTLTEEDLLQIATSIPIK